MCKLDISVLVGLLAIAMGCGSNGTSTPSPGGGAGGYEVSEIVVRTKAVLKPPHSETLRVCGLLAAARQRVLDCGGKAWRRHRFRPY
jgi:hypothetical protein